MFKGPRLIGIFSALRFFGFSFSSLPPIGSEASVAAFSSRNTPSFQTSSRSSHLGVASTEGMAAPTKAKPWYSDASIDRDRSHVLKGREADWETIRSENARFIMQTADGMCHQQIDSSPAPLLWTYSQLEELIGRTVLEQSTTGDDIGKLLAWVGKHEGQNYWVCYNTQISHEQILQKYPHAKIAGLREIGDSLLSSIDAAILATCNGLVEFHRSHPFCSRCGSKTRTSKAGGSRKCTSEACGASTYPRIDVAAIMLVTSRCGEYALLGRKAFWPKGRYSTLAGFAEIGETMEQCCARETFEESGVKTDPSTIEFACSQPWPFPRSLMVGFRAKAQESGLPEIQIEEDEMESVRWFRKDYVRQRVDGGSTALSYEPAEKEQEFHIPGQASLARLLITQWVKED